MKRIESSLLLGLGLVGAGVLFLLQNLGLLGPAANLLWALAFAIGGALFLIVFATNRAAWWAAIPGCTLLGLGVVVLLPDVALAAKHWGGALFLGAISLGFWTVWLSGRERWWAIIPGGVLLTLALLAGLSEVVAGADQGWVFFLGLALTFGLLAAVPTPGGRITWAIYPAAGLLGMAVAVLLLSCELFGYFWSAVLILSGLVLAYRAVRTTDRAAPTSPRSH
jgi:hypothetical protein